MNSKGRLKKIIRVWKVKSNRLIRLDVYQSAVTLYIYRVGWSVPIRNQNPYKSRIKIQLLTRIGFFRPVWSVSGPVWPVRPGCRSSGRHNFLIRSPNWTFYICISIVSTRYMQWWSPIDNLTKFSLPVWPVYTTGLTVRPVCPTSLDLCQFWLSTPRQRLNRTTIHISQLVTNKAYIGTVTREPHARAWGRVQSRIKFQVERKDRMARAPALSGYLGALPVFNTITLENLFLYCIFSQFHIRFYSLCFFLFVVFGVRTTTLTRFIENTCNIYITK